MAITVFVLVWGLYCPQAKGLQTEYMRATADQAPKSTMGQDDANKAEISKLIADKQKLTVALQEAEELAAAAKRDAAAVKSQAQVRCEIFGGSAVLTSVICLSHVVCLIV
jgi:hypothetical protein